jgi:hypothetical protein
LRFLGVREHLGPPSITSRRLGYTAGGLTSVPPLGEL